MKKLIIAIVALAAVAMATPTCSDMPYVPNADYIEFDCGTVLDFFVDDMEKVSTHKEGVNKVKTMLGTKAKQANYVCYVEYGRDADTYTAIKKDFSAFIMKTNDGFQIGQAYDTYGPTIYRYYKDGFKEDVVWEKTKAVSNKAKSIRQSVIDGKKFSTFWMGN